MMNDIGNNIDQYGDGYMEPEEEWEREGLLDPAWEKQQKKVTIPHTTFSLLFTFITSLLYLYLEPRI